jgi:hypothetical protein
VRYIISTFLFISICFTNAATIDFDSAAYDIPSGQLSKDANGVDGWESTAFLGFVVPSPGIGTGQALGFGPKYVLPASASESIKKDVNFALTGNTSGAYTSATGTFTADVLVNQPNLAAGNDVFGISLYGNAGSETISFTFDPANKVSNLAGDLGVNSIANAYYNSQYQFKVSFSGSNGDIQTYAATLIDGNGGSFTQYGQLTSTSISSIGLTYGLADSNAALTTASDGYILMDNAQFSASIPEPSSSLLSLMGLSLLILKRRR